MMWNKEETEANYWYACTYSVNVVVALPETQRDSTQKHNTNKQNK